MSFPSEATEYGSGNVTIADATGSVALRINAATDIDGTPAPTTPFSIVAVLGQFDSTPPFDSGYQLLPRSVDDITPIAGVITAAPTPLAFGTVSLGGSAALPVTITNVSGSSVTLTSPFTQVSCVMYTYEVRPVTNQSMRSHYGNALVPCVIQGQQRSMKLLALPTLDVPQRTTAAGQPATLKAMVWRKPRKFSSVIDSPCRKAASSSASPRSG